MLTNVIKEGQFSRIMIICIVDKVLLYMDW